MPKVYDRGQLANAYTGAAKHASVAATRLLDAHKSEIEAVMAHGSHIGNYDVRA
jgi:hypothetical protein